MEMTILDGSIGQELVNRAPEAPTRFWGTKVMDDAPDILAGIHRDDFEAGAMIATTNTYGLHHDRFVDTVYSDRVIELHQTARDIALRARDEHGSGQVGASLGPLGWSYRTTGCPPVEQAAKIYSELVTLHDPHVDLFLIETVSSITQARGALMGCGNASKPVWLGLSVDDTDGSKLRSGEALADILPIVAEFSPAAVLLNCSPPEAISKGLTTFADAGVPFGAYANGFTKITDEFTTGKHSVDVLETRKDLDPVTYADFVQDWVDMGATIIGGCCEVGPNHIIELSRRFS